MPELKMPQINCISLSGRLLRDPELKYGANGTAYIKTGIAIDDGFGDKKKSYFLDIAAFGKLAERMHPELSKGVPVYLEGRLTIEEWEAKDGSGKRSRVVVMCNRLDRLTWPEKQEYLEGAAKSTQDNTPAPDDDIPF